MIDLLLTSLRDQHVAANDTLASCVELCPDEAWTDVVGERAFWEVAMHALFFSHLYLTMPGEEPPGPPEWAWYDACGMGYRMDPPYDAIPDAEMGPAPDCARVLEWARAVTPRLEAALARETEASLAGPSGFDRLPIPRAQLYLYNLRHIQHHAGQLAAVLRRRDIQVAWFGMNSSGWSARG